MAKRSSKPLCIKHLSSVCNNSHTHTHTLARPHTLAKLLALSIKLCNHIIYRSECRARRRTGKGVSVGRQIAVLVCVCVVAPNVRTHFQRPQSADPSIHLAIRTCAPRNPHPCAADTPYTILALYWRPGHWHIHMYTYYSMYMPAKGVSCGVLLSRLPATPNLAVAPQTCL